MDSFYDAPRRPPTPTRFEKINLTVLSVPEISIISTEKPTNPTTKINQPIRQTYNNDEMILRNILPSKRVHFQGTSSTNQCNQDIRNCRLNMDGNKENLPNEIGKNFDLNGKTFKHIYMANIPNRDLDLSILEPNFNKPKPISTTTTKTGDESVDFGRNFKEFKEKFPIHPSKRLETANFTKPYQPVDTVETQYNPVEICRKIDKSVDCRSLELQRVPDKNQEPTIKDLLEIIKQQNQQIMSLQQQLFNLQNTLQNNNNNNQQVQQFNDGPSKKFSIDLKATSFEVSFRPQKYQKYHNCEPTIQEITETTDTTKNDQQDLRLNLQQSIDVGETCPSPTPSIRIDMDDYNDDNNNNSSEEDEEEEIGTTLYEDIMGQVNKMLENVRLQNNKRNPNIRETVEEVKEATIRYLRDDCKKLRYKPSEVSFAVKQLLLKYLPDEQLANFKLNESKTNAIPKKINNSNEFSIATLEYMKKYNLLNHQQKMRRNDKILDISTLKLQPKLL